MKITFFGGAETVTGSKYLIETEGYNLLLDCGMHQGKRKITNELNKNLPFLASKIDSVIISHAHMDHSGMLPILVRDGFKGKIYCTAPTVDIAKFILEDSANIQKNDALYYNKHLKSGELPVEPIYTDKDVKKTFGHFTAVPYFRLSQKWIKLNKNIRFKFYDAGHILGSAVTLLEIKDGGVLKNLVFTGDLGRHYLPILRDPEFVEENAETLIIEATYGSRIHKPITDLEMELKGIVYDAVSKKSKIIVPAFSLGRTQELIYVLHKLIDEKSIPSLPIFIDSPLSQKITRVFHGYTSDFDEEFWKNFGEKDDPPFLFKDLTTINSVEESKSINYMQGPLMVIAGSGMCEGGRILHHLKSNIENSNNIVLITGYQEENTLGRKILEGITPFRIFGREYQVKAKVITLNEFSAHADQKDLLSYIGKIKGLKNVFLVHSELKESTALKRLAEKENPNILVNIPKFGEEF